MATVKNRRVKEDPIPENLVLPPNEVLLAPINSLLLRLKLWMAYPTIMRQVRSNDHNVRTSWLILTSDRPWWEKLRRLRAHFGEELQELFQRLYTLPLRLPSR